MIGRWKKGYGWRAAEERSRWYWGDVWAFHAPFAMVFWKIGVKCNVLLPTIPVFLLMEYVQWDQ